MESLNAKESLNAEEDDKPSSADGLRSTKKVRIRSDGMDGGTVEGMAEPDVVMAGKKDGEGSSYRNKLLNLSDGGKGNRSLPEVVIIDNDFLISSDGDIPSIDFSKELVDVEGGFFFATFDLEEDYTKVLTGGPWMIFGAYITVQPWSIAFDPRTANLSNAVVWLRISGLSFRYYHKFTLRAIGRLLGEVIKIDYTTETRGRGRYARIAVLVDLQKPLVPWIKVDGRTYGVEYEGLPLICFECGRIGHAKDKCPQRTPNVTSVVSDSQAILTDGSPGGKTEGEQSKISGGRSLSRAIAWGESRFNVLFDCEDLEANVKAQIKENVGRKIRNGIGSGIMGQVSVESENRETKTNVIVKRQPKHSQNKPKVRVHEYRIKPQQEGPLSNSQLPSIEEHTPPSEPLTVVGDVTLDKSLMEITQTLNPESAGSDTNNNNECPVPVPSPVATTLDGSRHTVVELCQTRHALTEVKQVKADFSGGQPVVKKRGGVSQKGKENMNVDCGAPSRRLHGVNLRSSSAKSLKILQARAGSLAASITSSAGPLPIPVASSGVDATKPLEEAGGESGEVDGRPNAHTRMVRRIQNLLKRDWRITVSHVYREGNQVGGFLATYALGLEVGYHSLPGPPDGIAGLLREDAEETSETCSIFSPAQRCCRSSLVVAGGARPSFRPSLSSESSSVNLFYFAAGVDAQTW
ncbi:hypothetical protein K1719_045853 [Acacia pycnantha]|nr:hypothetical protein K1719_045853 [Acacia pycnantha]